MLRLRDGQAELFDAVMPAEVRTLSAELALWTNCLMTTDSWLPSWLVSPAP